jgi:F0F1-type ATP synthase assembly protein I
MSSIHNKIGKDFSLQPETREKISGKSSQNDTLLIAKYSSIGYYLVTPLLLGVFLGLWVDAYFHSKPLFTLVGIAIGFISAAYSLYKLIKDTQS